LTGAPLVSVIVPCFNAGPMLRPALASVIAQSWANLEIVFVDNNSTDGSAALAHEIGGGSKRPIRFATCATQGASAARNHGYGLARGDYIQWFDADDCLAPDKIDRQVEALERDPGAAIAYCDWSSLRQRAGQEPLEHKNRLAPLDDQVLRTLSGVWYPPHAYLVRRDAADRLQQEEAWWPARRIGTDVEYSAMAALLGFRFLYVAETSVTYNIWSDAQLSGGHTSYALRLAQLRDVYARLARVAARPDVALRIEPRYRDLLAVDWNCWSMPRGSVEIAQTGPDRFRLRNLTTGLAIEAPPRELLVARAMVEMGLARAILHHALVMERSVPVLAGDIPFIVAALERFRRGGLLTLVEAVAPAA
jgi:hypothetical protein